MKINIKTKVNGNYLKVMKAFDLDLFEALKPPIGKMEVVEFTGSKKGDTVHIKFLSPLKAEWISEIIEDGINEKMAYFIDVGTKLPWPLASWTHRHIVEKVDENTSMIVDDISYFAKNPILSYLIYPAMYMSFYPRKSVYRSYFKKKFGH